MCLIRARNYRWMPSLRGVYAESKPRAAAQQTGAAAALRRRRRRCRMAALEVRTFLMSCSIPLGRAYYLSRRAARAVVQGVALARARVECDERRGR